LKGFLSNFELDPLCSGAGLPPSLEKGFLKGFDPEEFPDLEARESSELFLVEILGLFDLSELLLSLLILKISAKIVI
jgi:hypothetical protein